MSDQQPGLFAGNDLPTVDISPVGKSPVRPPDFYLEYARKIGGVPEEWTWFKLEVVGYQTKNPMVESILITGAVAPVITKGKRTGLHNWKLRDRRTECSLSISRPALAEFKRGWELDTGKCSECGGSGQESAGWSASEGAKWRPCPRCNSTGHAPDKTVPL